MNKLEYLKHIKKDLDFWGYSKNEVFTIGELIHIYNSKCDKCGKLFALKDQFGFKNKDYCRICFESVVTDDYINEKLIKINNKIDESNIMNGNYSKQVVEKFITECENKSKIQETLNLVFNQPKHIRYKNKWGALVEIGTNISYDYKIKVRNPSKDNSHVTVITSNLADLEKIIHNYRDMFDIDNVENLDKIEKFY